MDPILKCAGGKRKLVPTLLANMPKQYDRYFEPFFGGGALFFALETNQAVLSDKNEELINAYRMIRTDCYSVMAELSQFATDEASYRSIRAWDRQPDFMKRSPRERAARFIYINRVGYNGLWRVNKKGQCNVPYGAYDYTNRLFYDPCKLLSAAEKLHYMHAWLDCVDFEDTLKNVTAGDFVYADPPYTPVNDTSDFTAYTANGFTDADHLRLRERLRDLDRRGAMFLLSNSDTPITRLLYKDFHIIEVEMPRMINSKAEGRGPVKELLIRNY